MSTPEHPPAAPAPRRDAGADHAHADHAPEVLDLRLAPAACAAWAAAAWGTGATGTACAWGSGGLAAVGAALAVLVLGYRPPRHRLDLRPGAQGPRAAGGPSDSVAGPPAAALMVAALAAAGVLGVAAAQHRVRDLDPLTQAARSGQGVTVVGVLATAPRAVASQRAVTVLVALDVHSVDGAPSRLTATVLGDEDWLGLEIGTRIRIRTKVKASEPGHAEAAVIGRGSSPRPVGEPQGMLRLVGQLRAGLRTAVGHEPQAGGRPTAEDRAPSASCAWPLEACWPPGTRELVVGMSLGDDSRLAQGLRQDMRAVSLTHLTAVSGQHVVLVVGTVLAAAGALPRRIRAALGATVLAGLVVVVQPSGSVLRAAVMGAVMISGVVAGRRSLPAPALCAATVLLVLIDPWQARDYGFVLSVVATAAIVLAASPTQSWLARRAPRWLAALVAVPLVAQTACAPVLVLLSPRVGAWSVVANVVAAPVVPLATLSGLGAALVAPLWPAAAAVVAWPALVSSAWVAQSAHVTAGLPGASLDWPGGVVGAVTLAAVEGVGVLAVVASRGRLWPWQRPGPPEPPAHGRRPRRARAGTRSTSHRSS